jgi:hypothetical protein
MTASHWLLIPPDLEDCSHVRQEDEQGRRQWALSVQRIHFRHEFGEGIAPRYAPPTAAASGSGAQRLVLLFARGLFPRHAWRSRLRGRRGSALCKQSAACRELGWRRDSGAFGMIRRGACCPACTKRTRHERGQFLIDRCGGEFFRLVFSRSCTLGTRWAQHGTELCLSGMRWCQRVTVRAQSHWGRCDGLQNGRAGWL